jgi:Domain of unknown function (DUF5625)
MGLDLNYEIAQRTHCGVPFSLAELASWAGSRTQLSKLITYIKLPPGHYRVHRVALDAVPELASTKVNLRILIERK